MIYSGAYFKKIICIIFVICLMTSCNFVNRDRSSSNATYTEDRKAIEDKEKFVEVYIGYEGLYALTNHGAIYLYCVEDEHLSLLMNGVSSLSEPYFGQIVFVRNGKIESLQELNANFTAAENVKNISGNTVITEDNQVNYFYNDSWHSIDIVARKLVGTDIYAVILDENNALWACQFEDGSLEKVADNVIDFDFYPSNKVHYTNDIWYITVNKELYVEQLMFNSDPYNTPTTPVVTEPVQKVVAESGNYLLQLENGTYLYGGEIVSDSQKVIPIQGIHQDIDVSSYAIVDRDGVIHFESESVILSAGAEPIKHRTAKIQLP